MLIFNHIFQGYFNGMLPGVNEVTQKNIGKCIISIGYSWYYHNKINFKKICVYFTHYASIPII